MALDFDCQFSVNDAKGIGVVLQEERSQGFGENVGFVTGGNHRADAGKLVEL